MRTGRAAGSGGVLAAALNAWPMLRFEVTEEPIPGVDGQRFCYVPGLGLWRARTSANGDIVAGEVHLRALLAKHPLATSAACERASCSATVGPSSGAVPAAGDGARGHLVASGRRTEGWTSRAAWIRDRPRRGFMPG